MFPKREKIFKLKHFFLNGGGDLDTFQRADRSEASQPVSHPTVL